MFINQEKPGTSDILSQVLIVVVTHSLL